MLLAVIKRRALLFSLKNSFALAAVICVAIASQPAAAIPAANFQSSEDLRFELPANGNLRIENLRGGVITEVWQENYVSVAAITDSGRQSS